MTSIDWRSCVQWLVRFRVLSSDHQLDESYDGRVEDLVRILKDGVTLCLLLNRMQTYAISHKSISLKPQTSHVSSCPWIHWNISRLEGRLAISQCLLILILHWGVMWFVASWKPCMLRPGGHGVEIPLAIMLWKLGMCRIPEGRYLHYRGVPAGIACRFRYSANGCGRSAVVDRRRPAATQVASLCTYIRVWLIQVSGHVGFIRVPLPIFRKRPRPAATLTASLCSYIRVWLIQVSGHLYTSDLYTSTATGWGYGPCSINVHKYLHLYCTGTCLYLWTINTSNSGKSPTVTPVLSSFTSR